MSKFTVAAQLYTLREYLKTEENVISTFKKVKDIGYNAIQISGVGPVSPELIKNVAMENDLKICATHISFDRLKSDIEAVIKEHKLWDCKYVGVGSMPEAYRNDGEGYKRFAVEASELGKVLFENGLHLIYHNHSFEFKKFNGITGMDILFNESNDETLQFEIDTYWIQHGGADPIAWIKKMNNRMHVVHFKDMIINEENKQAMAEVGEGNINWKGVIEACNEINVKWAAVEQDVCVRNAFDCLATSRENLIKLGCKF
jgi:sugar phosphate isomerase/epimerase